jgi:Trk K+ transport system NAD-binding subunit
MEQHYILCGLGRVGWRVLEYLRAAGLPVVVIDNRASPDDPRLRGVPLVKGDCRQQETLEQAELWRARGVLMMTSDDLVNISATLMVRRLRSEVRVVVRMFNPNLVARLGKLVHNVFALSTSALTAPLLALIAQTGEALGTFTLEDGRRRQVSELTVRENSSLIGKRVADLNSRREVLVVAYVPVGRAGRFFHEIDPQSSLAAGDRLVVCGDPRRLAPLLAQFENETLPELLWAGFTRRMGRMLWGTLAEIDLSVKICTGVLFGVIAASTLVFYFGMDFSVADGLYRTISLMATGADMEGKSYPEEWERIFVSILRLVGAALTAAFTAIVTNYLVRAQLGGALEVRRIPDSGHIIVCGMGNVGFRVVEELLRLDERVVVLERSRDNHFITTARRLGVPVIIGDATVPEVLRQGHAATARAVVVTTDDELTNLEVALLVREQNPEQRVVVRLTDPHLAETLRQAADVRLALSIPTLAAPAFVAALFGDRVQSVFLVEGKLVAAVELLVQETDSFLEGQSVRALAVDYQLLPISLSDAGHQTKEYPLEARLQKGDRLTAILSLTDLQRLLQREKAPSEYAVDVTDCPIPARPWLAGLLRTREGLNAEEAEKRVKQLPLALAVNLTRGEAEDLLARLLREKVVGRLRRANQPISG